MFILWPLVIALNLSAGKSSILDICFSSADCLARNSQCQIISASCGSGSCTCIPGFLPDSTMTDCFLAVSLNRKCIEGETVCETKGAECIDGICQCPAGKILGPGSNSLMCIDVVNGFLALGEPCQSDNECFPGHSRCIKNHCKCQQGFRTFNAFTCIERRYGDVCNNDTDCSSFPNMVCSDQGKCHCDEFSEALPVTMRRIDYHSQEGYVHELGYACYLKLYTARLFSPRGKRAASPPKPTGLTEIPQQQGEVCIYDAFQAFNRQIFQTNTGEDASTKLEEYSSGVKLCSAPFQCKECSKNNFKCLLPSVMYSTASGGKGSKKTISLIFAGAVYAIEQLFC